MCGAIGMVDRCEYNGQTSGNGEGNGRAGEKESGLARTGDGPTRASVCNATDISSAIAAVANSMFRIVRALPHSSARKTGRPVSCAQRVYNLLLAR